MCTGELGKSHDLRRSCARYFSAPQSASFSVTVGLRWPLASLVFLIKHRPGRASGEAARCVRERCAARVQGGGPDGGPRGVPLARTRGGFTRSPAAAMAGQQRLAAKVVWTQGAAPSNDLGAPGPPGTRRPANPGIWPGTRRAPLTQTGPRRQGKAAKAPRKGSRPSLRQGWARPARPPLRCSLAPASWALLLGAWRAGPGSINRGLEDPGAGRWGARIYTRGLSRPGARLLAGLDPVAGQPPPAPPRPGGDFARHDREDGRLRRRIGNHGPVLRAPARDRAAAHGAAGRPSPVSRPGRQGDPGLPLRPVGPATARTSTSTPSGLSAHISYMSLSRSATAVIRAAAVRRPRARSPSSQRGLCLSQRAHPCGA